jgi:enamine deaminase RidA (YjgF/YER057c/UK114 family)
LGLFDGLLNIITPKKQLSRSGISVTSDYNPFTAQQTFLAPPTFAAFRDDILTTRQQNDSQTILKNLFRSDPDVSAALNGYLTLANTDMLFWAEDVDGNVDADASSALHTLMKKITRQLDYTQGYQFKQSLRQMCADLRYMLLLRGGIGQELIPDKSGNPESLRMFDLASIRFFEKQPGLYKPGQVVPGESDPVMLDSPSVFISFYRRDPTTIYSDSSFVASINTIAARQQVINDLYRIMQVTGYPRLTVSLVEEVVRNSAPANIKADATKLNEFVAAQVSSISSSLATLRPDQPFVHTDAVVPKIINDKTPGLAVDISAVVDTLNAQNQAGLKTMATILGRGSSGVNTGSVEARLAAMYADELNEPIAEHFAAILSFCLHRHGYQGFANVKFRKAELRPDTELEPQMVMKAQRLRQDLSDGLITDEEYSLEMYGRLPRPGAPSLSGTKFLTPAPPAATGGSDNNPNPADVNPKEGALNRSLAPPSSKMTKANPRKAGGAA